MSRQTMQIYHDPAPFICAHCNHSVIPPESGTKHRNHCPHCLFSRHVDMRIGDRRSGCRGLMEPIGIWVQERKEWALIHRCQKCGFIRTNRIAGDDNEIMLFSLAARPMMQLPFPAEVLLQQMRTQSIHGEES
jgi:predicted RNA-binding Zn-ribbon protein involved in translation (DUF1610 family)